MPNSTYRRNHPLAVIITLAVLGTTACDSSDGGPAPAPVVATTAAAGATGPDATTRKLEGIYRWTLTDEDALAHGTPNDQTQTALEHDFPSTMTVTLRNGTWSMEQTTSSDLYGGTYGATADRITFNWPAEHSVLLFTYAFDGGKLTLRAMEPMDAGDRFVWSTNPWTRIG
ncbi:hypothetical protein ACQP00_28445 [Dactylosporangium sp. CS-047395]|uniref:hypothetical protein n=1 Tax=Dactylosporangium sp. CS-047395 TaxID=3239936 RepID=UPI003D8B7D74